MPRKTITIPVKARWERSGAQVYHLMFGKEIIGCVIVPVTSMGGEANYWHAWHRQSNRTCNFRLMREAQQWVEDQARGGKSK
jgi:hypothetical protein